MEDGFPGFTEEEADSGGVKPHRCDRRGLESSLLACCLLLHWPKVLQELAHPEPETQGSCGQVYGFGGPWSPSFWRVPRSPKSLGDGCLITIPAGELQTSATMLSLHLVWVLAQGR